MPSIDFYLINEGDSSSRLKFICRLVEKAYQQKHKVYLQASSQTESQQLDQLLWTYRDDSFIPHGIYNHGQEPFPPVQIGHDLTPDDHRDILINLSDDVPNFYQQFSRILEIISNDPTQQAKARDRYRFYREKGFEIKTHKI